MSRKFVIVVVSVLGLMALAASAQQQGPAPEEPSRMPATGVSSVLGGNRPRGEEIELARESEELVRQLGRAEGEGKEKIKARLAETLGRQFDVRQKRHEAELATLEAQVKKLGEMVQKRQENRRDIIGKRLEALVREAEGLGW